MAGERQANENTNENENKNKNKNEIEKRLEEMKSILEKQEKRLHDLQSTAFQLANFYFVFQGVILASISKGPSASACSDRWFFFTLSSLAAIVNLLALFVIGLRYKRILAHQYETQAQCNNLLRELDKLKYKRIQAYEHESQAKGDGLSEELDKPRTDQSIQVLGMPRDRYREIKHNIYFSFCVLLFLGFAGVTLYGCFNILCKKDACTTRLHNDKCLNVCDDFNCIRLCT